jgi:hypothetical protein
MLYIAIIHTTPHFFESVQRLEGNQMLELDF